MQFLNLTINIPGNDSLKLKFEDGLNIIRIPDSVMFERFRELMPSILRSAAFIPGTINAPYQFNLTTSGQGGTIRQTGSGESRPLANPGSHETSDSIRSIRTAIITELLPVSLYDPRSLNDNNMLSDIAIINSVLSKNKIIKENLPELNESEPVLAEKKKELNRIDKEKQLLELKKIKKDKLQNEIISSGRELNKIIRKKEACLNYKKSLGEIELRLEEERNISSAINNLKKDIIEHREIKSKITAIEKDLKARFPQFTGRQKDPIPDLDCLQEKFNSFRDINENIDRYFINRESRRDVTMKIVTALLIFSVISTLFVYIGHVNRTSSMLIWTAAGLSAVIAAITALYFFIQMKRLFPQELLKQKEAIQQEIITHFNREEYQLNDCRTGELYEFLFQFFDDMLNFRDMQGELAELKKRLSKTSITEKEGELKKLISRLEEIRKTINRTVDGLNESVHLKPDLNRISDTVNEINDSLAEIESDIERKNRLIKKLEDDAIEYEKKAVLNPIEAQISELETRIKSAGEEIDLISFLKEVYKDTSDSWISKKINELSEVAGAIFFDITGNRFSGEGSTGIIQEYILSGMLPESMEKFAGCASLSLKAAFTRIFPGDMFPPLVLIDPFFSEDQKITANLKKILLELSGGRQILLLTSGNEPELKGNLISI